MNRDGIAILLRRLRALPKELEPLYDYLLGRIDPVYMEWASKAFQIARTSRQLSSAPFGKAGQGVQHVGVQPISILIFHLAIIEDLNTYRRNTCEALVLTCRDTEIHLAARCAGLLELGSLNSGSAIKTKAPYLDRCIQWLHRTVREYLEDGKCWSYLLTHTPRVNFNPSVSLMSDYVFTASFRVHIDPSDLFVIANCAIIYGYWATSYITTLQSRSTALHSTYHLMNSRLTSKWGDLLLGKRGYSFPVLATAFGLTDYIRFCRPLPSSIQVTRLLEELLEPNWMACTHIALPPVRVEMLSLLLRLGARPHEPCRRILHNIVNCIQCRSQTELQSFYMQWKQPVEE